MREIDDLFSMADDYGWGWVGEPEFLLVLVGHGGLWVVCLLASDSINYRLACSSKVDS